MELRQYINQKPVSYTHLDVYKRQAYTAVDAAEDEGKELDYAINVTGTENVAKASEKHGATLVYISTDYVFDGKKPVGQEWEVDDQPRCV